MTIKQVLTKNPKITEELREFFLNVLLRSIDNTDISSSFKKSLEKEGVNTDMIENYLTANPRLICDFMDDKNIIIEIIHDSDAQCFTTYIDKDLFSREFKTRKEAETAAVIESILIYKEKEQALMKEL